MAPPLNRREFLSTVTLGAAGASFAALMPARAQAQAQAFCRELPGGEWHFPAREELLPFGHAVASGDPLQDRVILWTRITIPDARGWDVTQVPDPQGFQSVDVGWVIASDPELQTIVNSGVVSTDASRDFTVKVDADGLQPGTTYWYAFTALGFRSPIGRTRTAPATGQGITELTIGHVSCTSWWQDFFNGYGRMGARNDIDLITNAGDHVYEVSGNHMSSRQYPDKDGNPQIRGYEDIDNRDWRTIGENRRRYALYYQCPNMLAAHLAAPFVVLGDNHDYDATQFSEDAFITLEQSGEVFHEWTPQRPTLADGSGRWRPFTGPNEQVDIPRGLETFNQYRVLDFGDVAQIIVMDVRYQRDENAVESKLLGDKQWNFLTQTLLDGKARGVRHNVLINQHNMSQLGTLNTPFYTQYQEQFQEMFGIDPRGPELYTTSWGGFPEERRKFYQWLRDNEIRDNIVLSGDSHGWFASDLTEDPQLPNYLPRTGLSPLPVVGVEMVGTAMGRPGAQDVVADTLYWQANGGRQNAPFDDAETYDAVYRPAALPAAIAIEAAAQVANPNLIYFNWKAQYGYTMVHLRESEAFLEAWTTPQREMSEEQTLLIKLRTPRGNPHLTPVEAAPLATGEQGSRQDPPIIAPQTVLAEESLNPPVEDNNTSGADSGNGSGSGSLGVGLGAIAAAAALAQGLSRRRAAISVDAKASNSSAPTSKPDIAED
nr:alkaline phosphatase D family protein [Oceanococcus sp. HetDA_MAG_MS8]